MKTISVPAGIGDNIWLLMKLINTGEKFNFKLPDGFPQRGKQIFDLLPSVSNSCEYASGLTYEKIRISNIQSWKRNWSEITENNFFLSMNTWLENGKRIERFFPDLPTSFRIDWHTSATSSPIKPNGKELIGIYGSSYSTSRSWGFWDAKKWMELIKLCGKDYRYVIIGADWDLDLGRDLIEMLEEEKYDYVNTIGRRLGHVIEVMKNLKVFFGFPSGLSILAPTVNCNTIMFYPNDLKLMINAWASPEDIASTLYKGCLFCEPEEIYRWAKDNGKV
jgi:hypothetical protein